MKRNLDLGTLGLYFLPATLLVAALVYIFFRKMIFSYLDLRNQVRIQDQIAKTRQNSQQAAGKPEPVIVRRTDLFDKLTSEQKVVFKQAEELVALKKFVEASKLYESIDFQRKAIDVLEFNGYVEQAASVLLRMNVPFRAAVIYERNNQPLKAAECFIIDGKHDNAARCFEKMAVQDFSFFRQAGENYLKAGMVDNCLEAYGKILLNDEILKIAIGSGKYEFLANYMADPYNAKYVLERIKPDQIKSFLQSLLPRPSWVQSMSVWVLYHHDLGFLKTILEKLVGKEDLAQIFWVHLNSGYCRKLFESVTANPEFFTPAIYHFHSKVLSKQQKTALADLFALHGPDPTEAPAPTVPDFSSVPKFGDP